MSLMPTNRTVCAICHMGKCVCWLESKRPHERTSQTVQTEAEYAEQPVSEKQARNPKDIVGSSKLPLYLWPIAATAVGVLAMFDGMLKYGRNNWRRQQISFSEYIGASLRHIGKLLEGEWYDKDSGIPHVGHILATWAIVIDAYATGRLIDDRNYEGAKVLKYLEELTTMVPELKARHADKQPHHWTIADDGEDVR